MTANLSAFLSMISTSEGTAKAPDPYRICFGGYVIIDLTYHPAERRPDGTREWDGERLADRYCLALNLPVGCVSTAAGRYQITRPTFSRLQALLRLPTFAPDAQDDCAVQLLKEVEAFDLINGGEAAEAIARCHPIWASFPGSTSGQPQTEFAALIHAYTDAGGAFA